MRRQALSEELRTRLLGWRHSGFSVHNQVRVGEQDAEGCKKLAGYMLRAPMSLQKMIYDAASGTVIYRSKMHAGLKRNFQLMSGAAWLEHARGTAPAQQCHMGVRRFSRRPATSPVLVGLDKERDQSRRTSASASSFRAGLILVPVFLGALAILIQG